MAPAELKKYRNKQRKARKRAEVEKEKQTAAQEKREQHIKSRQQQDGEADGVKEEELVPEKLAKTEDSLGQAIRFLRPLQNLASERIETHLLAFEIYIRKDKLLLMLQSIKRAWLIDPNHPKLHSNLIRFCNIVSSRKEIPAPVKTVLEQEMERFYKQKSAHELNEEFLAQFSNSMPHLLQGARMKYCLDKQSQEKAISYVTNFNNQIKGVTIQNCIEVLEAMRNGDLGSCDKEMASFLTKCQELFPYATVFRQAHENNVGPTTNSVANHVDSLPKEE
ncbi:n-alpha-acetyltransferase 15, NatA auxiliary subunit [Caerostris darwini]|uniref:N-alpha-acetyltransferase 15, NatA auxiliary subunit n=1 Tax=Caerostris darwini TaxID=1538125 RepID=A0AAV4PQZ2_9ARAC|nr:n-alpha-acetyltransferase 15, NatA auxiliary subunit [Caerostris darwini]